MGVETGDPELLPRIGKRVDYGQMVEAGRKAIDAGITLSVTVILGLAGVEGSERHARETARILSDIDHHYAGALTLTLVPGTPIYEQVRLGKFKLLPPLQASLTVFPPLCPVRRRLPGAGPGGRWRGAPRPE